MNNLITPMWTLEQAVTFARGLEHRISRIYNHYHVAIGGSVLKKGESNKDLDIFIYPHQTGRQDRKYLTLAIKAFGLVKVRDCEHSSYQDGKEVIEYDYQGKRVDMFFLECEKEKSE